MGSTLRGLLAVLAALSLVAAAGVEVPLALARRQALCEAGDAAARLREAAEAPTHASHAAAARAATAIGRFDEAARHAEWAARLLPGDAAARAEADRAADRAAIALLRPPARLAGGAGAVVLLALAVRATLRRRAGARRGRWLDGVAVDVRGRVEGRTSAGALRMSPASSVTIDVFLAAPPPRPVPGPTVSVALSHAGSSRTVRLAPRRDVRDDAVRWRLSPETVAALLAAPGRWRLQTRVDGRLADERAIEVVPAAERVGA
jgi:hypothetical protein